MKIKLTTLAVALLLGGISRGQEPVPVSPEGTHAMTSPSKLGSPAHLKKYNVTIRRFDPKEGLKSGEDFMLPVDCIDEEHAISSTLSNAVAFTKKSQGSEILSVAFCCTKIEERK